MNPSLALDYLFVGALIRARLAAQIPELALDGAVRGIEELDQAVSASINAPIVFVAWDGDLIDASDQGRAGGGRSQMIQQAWSILIAVRNASQHDQAARNATAGPLLASVHAALAGWTPGGGFKPLQRIQGRRAQYTPNVGLYPLAFQIQLAL